MTLFAEGAFRVRLLLMFSVEFRDRFGGGCVAHSTFWSFWWDVSWVLLGCLLGVSCVSLGCPVYPWVSLGVSWVAPGVPPGYFLCVPGWPVCFLVCPWVSWVSPGCFHQFAGFHFFNISGGRVGNVLIKFRTFQVRPSSSSSSTSPSSFPSSSFSCSSSILFLIYTVSSSLELCRTRVLLRRG